MSTIAETVICPECHGDGYVEAPSGDPQLPRDLVPCPCCHGQVLTKRAMRQYQRDNAPVIARTRGTE